MILVQPLVHFCGNYVSLCTLPTTHFIIQEIQLKMHIESGCFQFQWWITSFNQLYVCCCLYLLPYIPRMAVQLCPWLCIQLHIYFLCFLVLQIFKSSCSDRELYSNDISGSIPDELGNLTDLVSLDLYMNNLSGPIPTTLGGLSKLRFLYDHLYPSSYGPSQYIHLFFLDLSSWIILLLSIYLAHLPENRYSDELKHG